MCIRHSIVLLYGPAAYISIAYVAGKLPLCPDKTTSLGQTISQSTVLRDMCIHQMSTYSYCAEL